MPKTHEHTNPLAPQVGEEVYAYMPDSVPPLKKGLVAHNLGPDAMVNVGGATYYRVHKSHVFTPSELADTSMSLLPSPPDGKEIHFSRALKDITEHPLAGDELSLRLGMRALEKYTTTPRSPDELGLYDAEMLLGGVEIRGSNRWRVDELIRGVEQGIYTSGRNELNLCSPSEDLETLSQGEAEAALAEINKTNRQVLDTLYEEYDADFSSAMVYERHTQRHIERSTVIPSKVADFCFIETTYLAKDGSINPKQAAVHLAQIATGQDDYYSLEKGYLPSV